MDDGRTRLDVALVARGLAPSRERAQRLIAAGLVRVGDRDARKPSEKVGDVDLIAVLGQDIPYVSRGGLKLERALDRFGVDPAGRVCMDIGASTGGFTDVLLRRGAERVYAIDVGTGQLDPGLAADPRVHSMEQVNARTLSAAMFPVPPTLGVMDVSFISIRLILPAALAVLGPGGRMLTLVKPQFEAGRKNIGKRGIVTSAAAHEEVLMGLAEFLPTLSWRVRAMEVSPITGGDGNIEFLADLLPESACENSVTPEEIRALVRRAHSGGK